MASTNISDEIEKILNDYTKEVKRAANNSIDVVAKETVSKLKATSPKNKGRYARGWRLKRERGPLGVNFVTVYNATDYQLTHLLEHGHLIRNKKGTFGRAPAHPHIAPAEAWAIDELPKEITKELEE